MSSWQMADTWRSKRVLREGTGVYAGPATPQVQVPGAAGMERGRGHFLTCCCDRSCSPGPDKPRSPLHPAEEQRRCLGSGRRLRRQDQRPRSLLHDPPA